MGDIDNSRTKEKGKKESRVSGRWILSMTFEDCQEEPPAFLRIGLIGPIGFLPPQPSKPSLYTLGRRPLLHTPPSAVYVLARR